MLCPPEIACSVCLIDFKHLLAASTDFPRTNKFSVLIANLSVISGFQLK